jgi:hypothetical protein
VTGQGRSDLVRGVVSAAALLVLLAGVPAALVVTVGWPLPHTWPSVAGVLDRGTELHTVPDAITFESLVGIVRRLDDKECARRAVGRRAIAGTLSRLTTTIAETSPPLNRARGKFTPLTLTSSRFCLSEM